MAGRANQGLDEPGELKYKDTRVVYHENKLYELDCRASGQPDPNVLDQHKHDHIPTQYAPSHLIPTPYHPQTPESAPNEHAHNTYTMPAHNPPYYTVCDNKRADVGWGMAGRTNKEIDELGELEYNITKVVHSVATVWKC